MAKILVVDDELQIRVMLKYMLEQDQHDVIEAQNGTDGSRLYRETQPDLIITDLVMPEKNGIDMLLELRKDFPAVCVLAISGGGGITGAFDYLPIAKLVGASDVLRKPFGMQELREAVRKALDEAR
ncbi:MAG: response regulator [Gammaproteobacteria bacterium]|nr:response regulator [Gammaproteobacteria bacterium]